jgi:predicted P-loop ATPase
VLVGTTNEEQFLADPTGARRYWPLRVTRLVDIQKLKAWRDQLWAEAVAAYESRESWWLSASDETALAEAAEQFRSTDPWEEAVTTYIANVRPDAQHSTRSILSGIHIPDHLQNKQAANRISLIMQKLGYRTARMRDGEGHAPRVWKKEQSPEPGV